jgi:hypothetical protein
MYIKVGFDFYRYAIVEIEAKICGLSINKNQVELLYYATIKSLYNDGFIPAKPIEFEELHIMIGFNTIEECLNNTVVELRSRVKKYVD